jgi:hypothetical protein
MKVRASFLAVGLLVACAPAAYVEPTTGDTAILRIENQTSAVFGYALEADTYRDAGACAGRVRLADSRALPRGVSHNVRVRADEEFTLMLRGTGGGASGGDSCALAGTFTPSAGERYVAIFRSGERKCELIFARQQVAAGRRYAREPSYRERYEAPCLGTSAPSSTPARAAVPQLPPGSSAPPTPPLPPR